MERRQITLLLGIGVLMVQASATTAPAADFTCPIYGGSFVMDDTDFKALEPSGITREKFAALEPKSQIRVSVCDTRMVARLLKAGKASYCDLSWRYKNWAAGYLDRGAEVKAGLKAMDLPAVSEPWKNCR
jgi:hypothetical protein